MANKQKLSTTINKSIITKLRDQNKLNDSLLVLISNLTLEDLIAIKLELSCNLINNRLYGFDIWRNSNKIVQEAILKFAISTTKSKKDAARRKSFCARSRSWKSERGLAARRRWRC